MSFQVIFSERVCVSKVPTIKNHVFSNFLLHKNFQTDTVLSFVLLSNLSYFLKLTQFGCGINTSPCFFSSFTKLEVNNSPFGDIHFSHDLAFLSISAVKEENSAD